MHSLARLGRLMIACVAMLYGGSAAAGLDEGVAAIVKGDYATALKELRPLADRGNAEAQYRLGRMYEFGRGVPADMAQALAWLRKAAAQNNANAQQELGVMYASGEGVAQDDAQAVAWFRKAADQGLPTAQYNLGQMYAKGKGVKEDLPQAVAWFRKAADQGFSLAQFKLGVAYENGNVVPKDRVLSYANYAIAARDGSAEHVQYRDDIAKTLTPAQLREARALADAWQVGNPTPGSAPGAGPDVVAQAAAPAGTPNRPNKCSATGSMEGEKFTANNCVASLYGDQHSVAIWFNEDAISPAEAASFAVSSYASGDKAGRQRTMLQIMFCPGGGGEVASPAAVKSIDLNTNHARAALAGLQRVAEAPKDFRVEKLTGEIKPGAMLTGRIIGSMGKTSWNLDFDVKLPAGDAAAGMGCK